MEQFDEVMDRINANLKTAEFEKAFDFLKDGLHVAAMIRAVEKGRPALEGCVEELERQCHTVPGCDFDDHSVRKATGKVVAEILDWYGYKPTEDMPMDRNLKTRFKSASCYAVKKS